MYTDVCIALTVRDFMQRDVLIPNDLFRGYTRLIVLCSTARYYSKNKCIEISGYTVKEMKK